MKEEDDVDDEEEDDLTRQILSNQFGRINAIVQGGLVDFIPMKVIVQEGLVDLIPMK